MASTATLITFGIYLIAMLGIGIAGYFFTKNLDDYILGGRRLGGFVTALSAGASDMSGWLLMGFIMCPEISSIFIEIILYNLNYFVRCIHGKKNKL